MSRRKIFDNYAIMQHIPEITGMPDLVLRNGIWEGRYYINGERHPFKRDKLKIKIWKNNGHNSIWLHEQGGESLSLQNWLQRYGGASDYKEAESIMLGNSHPNGKLLNYIHSCEKAKEIKYVDESEYIGCSCYELERCPLFVWMSDMFGYEPCVKVWQKYHVTTDNNGLAVFWYTNIENKICYDKRIKYNYDGHRDKSFGGTRRFTTIKGYTERPLFGSHLIEDGKAIHVVESEKTALIASLYYPDRIFVGTGGKNGLHDIEDNMILYPDLDAVDYWSSRKGAIIHEWWNDFTCAIEDKDDIGDAIMKTLKK